ncbi:MAG: DUF5723 family protein [Chitinophagaceae bacterium]
MRTILFCSMLLLCVASASAQDFPDYQSGNYTGVNGVFFNPASIADSRYRWDFNLFSVNVSMANEKAAFSLSSTKDAFTGDKLVNQFFSTGSGTSTGIANVTILGPSLMFNTGKKSTVALTTRGRIMINAENLDGELLNALINQDDPEGKFPYGVNPNRDMRSNFNAWTEFGVTYSRVLMDRGEHFLKTGVTARYLSGSSNAYLNMNRFQGTLNQDPATGNFQISDASGRLQLGFSGANISDFDVEELTSFNNTGAGGDIGFVYEFRPDHEKYKYGNSLSRRDLSKYKWRFGLAVLDIGKIKYDLDPSRSADYQLDVSGAEELDLDEISNTSLDELRDYFNAHPQFFTQLPATGNNYSVSLPTSLHVDADYYINKGFYVNLDARLSMVNADKKLFNSQYYSTYSLTPRYEGRAFGFYLPVSYNEVADLTAGVCLRFGPLFVGSGSALTALFGDSKKADAYFGLRFGGLHKNKQKELDKKARKAQKEEKREAEK